jgi:hypothetical protein
MASREAHQQTLTGTPFFVSVCALLQDLFLPLRHRFANQTTSLLCSFDLLPFLLLGGCIDAMVQQLALGRGAADRLASFALGERDVLRFGFRV